jgi:hypothetical protein
MCEIERSMKNLGLEEIITKALIVDRSGSVVLEEPLCIPKKEASLFPMIGVSELVASTLWYTWWQHRQVTYGVAIPVACKDITSYCDIYIKLWQENEIKM